MAKHLDKIYDVVVVGSGAGAGPVIYELSKAGKQVLVLEKGPWFRTRDFRKDELTATRRSVYTPNLKDEFHIITYENTIGDTVSESTFESGWDFWNGNMVGGSSNLMSGYFHRMKPVDFRLADAYGEIEGADIRNWPVSYEELEPYYTKVEHVVGVSGKVVPHRFLEPRSTPDFPYPPLKENIVSGIIDGAAKQSGIEVIPTPRAILSLPKDDRKSCYYSNYCGSYGCASDAKGSSRVSLIREALKTGNCTVVTNAFVYHLETDGHFRVKRAWFVDAGGQKHAVRGKIFVVAAQAVESVRLLLLSKNKEFSEGLANNNGMVGKNLLFSAGGTGFVEFHRKDFDEATWKQLMKPGLFVNRSTQFFYETSLEGRKVKGGTVDFLWEHANPVTRAVRRLYDGTRLLRGRELKNKIYHDFTRTRRLEFEIFLDWLPYRGTYVTLAKQKDFRGFPVADIHIDGHPYQIRLGKVIAAQLKPLLDALPAHKASVNISNDPPSNLQAGGIIFGDNKKTSVLDKNCRAHDVDNLFVTDGSFMPTGGSVPYTWTIYANAFRVADVIKTLIS